MELTKAGRGFSAVHHSFTVATRRLLKLLVISSAAAFTTTHAQATTEPVLASAVIRGSSVYSAPQLFADYRDYLGQPITAASARAIAGNVAARYVADGYSQPAVTIDDRMTGAGVLVLNVTETRIAAVAITGDPGPYAQRLQALGGDFDDTDLLRSTDLQSAIRRMRDFAGLSLTASTTRDETTPGAYHLNLDTDFTPVSNVLRASNRGTDEIGPAFLIGQTTFNGLAAGRATLGLLYATTADYDEYHGAGLSGSLRVSERNAAVTVSGFRSRSDPSERLVDRDDRYVRDRLAVGFRRPIIDTAARRLTVEARLRAEDLAIDRAGLKIRDERLRIAEIGSQWLRSTGSTAQFLLRADLLHGIDDLGSGLYALDLASDPRRVDFSMLRLDFVRVVRLNSLWSWRLNALAQHSNDVVPYVERFKIGGDRLGRGFEVAEISGDRGIGARTEFMRNLPALSTGSRTLSAYLTYDLAAAWKNDHPGRESAATGGIGVAIGSQSLNTRIELAAPLTHPDVEGRDDLSLFAELTVNW